MREVPGARHPYWMSAETRRTRGARPAALAFGSLLLALFGASRTAPAPPSDIRAYDARPVPPHRQMSVVTLKRGHGREARPGDPIRVRYVGKPPSGDAPVGPTNGACAFDFVLGQWQVIEGWDEGILGMQVGEKRRLVIPPAMAYGTRGREGVSADERLVYEIELVANDGEGHDD